MRSILLLSLITAVLAAMLAPRALAEDLGPAAGARQVAGPDPSTFPQRPARAPLVPVPVARRAGSSHLREHGRRVFVSDGQAHAALFGADDGYRASRDRILGEIQRFYASLVPGAHGRFRSPRLFELGDDGELGRCGAIGNAGYCPPSNSIGWTVDFAQSAFKNSGDNAWAVSIAHEFGHGAQEWLGLHGGGFRWTLYSEGFADCMAGAWSFWMYYYGQLDALRRGDGNEFRDVFASLSDGRTRLGNHGAFRWRYGAALYGWDTGFNGCVAWGRWIAGMR
jgi:hypothetical protein